MADFEDSFTGTADTALSSHTPDVGTSWALSSGSEALELDGSGNIRYTGVNAEGLYLAKADPSSADHLIIWQRNDTQTGSEQIHPSLRISDIDNMIGWDWVGTGGIGNRVRKWVSGSASDMITDSGGGLADWFKIEANGNTIEFYDGSDGVNWNLIGSTTETFNNNATLWGIWSEPVASEGRTPLTDFQADTLGGGGGATGSITEGATAGETFGAIATAAASITEAASAGETMNATAAAAASLSAAVQAGDTEAGPAAALAAITAAADAGDTEAATAQAAAAITAGAAAGESWVAQVAALADITEGATADETMTTGTTQALEGAISEGSTAAAAFSAAAATLGSLTAAATAGESIAATVAAIASLSEGVQAGDTFTAGLEDEGKIVVQSIAIVAAVSGSPGIEASMKGAPGIETRLKGTPTIH